LGADFRPAVRPGGGRRAGRAVGMARRLLRARGHVRAGDLGPRVRASDQSAHPHGRPRRRNLARFRRRLRRRALQPVCALRHSRRVHRGKHRMGRLRLCRRRSASALLPQLQRDWTDRRNVRDRGLALRRLGSATGEPVRTSGARNLRRGALGPRLSDARAGRRLVADPIAVTVIGLGLYALHNTLQTNATQMTPQARGTAVAIFSSAIYLGQTLGVAVGALVFDRFTAVPLFVATAVALPALAWWFAGKLRRRTAEQGRPKTKDGRP